MAKIYETMLSYFQTDGWPVNELADADAAQIYFQGQNGQWMCFAQAREEQGQFVFYSLCPLKVSAAKRANVAEFIARANYGLIIGNFEMDFDDGEVRYKTSIDVEEAELTPELLRPLVYANVWTMDQYLRGLIAVI